MHIVSLALGGCIKGPPVQYGITEDTGGHITYILGEMAALARHPSVECAEIVTRLFDDDQLGPDYAQPCERLASGVIITRIDSGNRRYLAKEALAADRAAFVEAFIAELRARPRLPDLIHAHFADAADVACQVRERLGVPFIYTAHSLGIDKLDAMRGVDTGSLQHRIDEEDRAIRCADALIASSRDECERQLPRYAGADPTRIHRLRPGVAISRQSPGTDSARQLIAPFLREPDKPIVLAIARPVEKKNLAALVEAFGQDKELQQQANLVILAGLRNGLRSGEEEQRGVITGLLDAVDRHNLYGKVAYPPRHTQEQVQSLYVLASETGGIFVNPALTEPYGLTLVEAASHGLPVVSTRHGGPSDIVAELKNGLLVDPSQPSAIADASKALLEDREAWLTASRNGRERCRTMNWDVYATGFVELANELLAPPKVMPRKRAPAEMLVCDIDNTLTGCPESAQRFRRYLEKRDDLTFCVATGRSLIEARRILREWSLPAPDIFITSVGSEIHWRTEGRLRPDTQYARNIAESWHADKIELCLREVPGLTPQPFVDQRRFKLSYLAENAAVAAQVRDLLQEAGLPARVILSHGDMLDVLPRRAGKGAAVRHVAAVAGIAPSGIVAAGDSGNDLDMLEQCSNAVLVGNHDEDLRELARHPHVYVARRSHAAGVMEGHLQHARRRKAMTQSTRSAA